MKSEGRVQIAVVGRERGLPFFNPKTTERLVFRRRDRRCMTKTGSRSIIPLMYQPACQSSPVTNFVLRCGQTCWEQCRMLLAGVRHLARLYKRQRSRLQALRSALPAPPFRRNRMDGCACARFKQTAVASALPARIRSSDQQFLPAGRIHASDIMPDYVASLLAKCKALIVSSPRVVLLRPNGVQPDDVIYDGVGSALPHSCFDRTGVTLRTLDVVHFKCTAVDRKRDLLPIEEDLWGVIWPFL